MDKVTATASKTETSRPGASPCRTQHLSTRAKKAYVGRIRRYVRFHNLRHPSRLGAEHVRRFLSHLASEGRVTASTQN